MVGGYFTSLAFEGVRALCRCGPLILCHIIRGPRQRGDQTLPKAMVTEQPPL